MSWAQHPDGEDETLDDFIKAEHHSDGIGAWGCLTDPLGSSTRAEAAAAIIALVKLGPRHIATDSQALVIKMGSYLEHITRRQQLGIGTMGIKCIWVEVSHSISGVARSGGHGVSFVMETCGGTCTWL